MTTAIRKVLIVSAAVASNAIVGATFYIKGKKDGLKLAAKQQADALNASPATHSGNRRSEQAQA
jgi:hypothetical protein